MKNGLDLPEELVTNITFKIENIHLMISAGNKNESILCRSNFLQSKLNLLHYVSFIGKELWVYTEEPSQEPLYIQKKLTGNLNALQVKRAFYFCFQVYIAHYIVEMKWFDNSCLDWSVMYYQ